MAKRKTTVLEFTLANKMRSATPRKLTWLDRLSNEQREQLEEAKQLFNSGQLPGWSMSSFWELVHKEFGVKVCRHKFIEYLKS